MRGEQARAPSGAGLRLRAFAGDCALELLLGHARAAFDLQPLRLVVELFLRPPSATRRRAAAATRRRASATRAAARLRPTSGALRAGRARARPARRPRTLRPRGA